MGATKLEPCHETRQGRAIGLLKLTLEERHRPVVLPGLKTRAHQEGFVSLIVCWSLCVYTSR